MLAPTSTQSTSFASFVGHGPAPAEGTGRHDGLPYVNCLYDAMCRHDSQIHRLLRSDATSESGRPVVAPASTQRTSFASYVGQRPAPAD